MFDLAIFLGIIAQLFLLGVVAIILVGAIGLLILRIIDPVPLVEEETTSDPDFFEDYMNITNDYDIVEDEYGYKSYMVKTGKDKADYPPPEWVEEYYANRN